jgi:hypothetical protein
MEPREEHKMTSKVTCVIDIFFFIVVDTICITDGDARD